MMHKFNKFTWLKGSFLFHSTMYKLYMFDQSGRELVFFQEYSCFPSCQGRKPHWCYKFGLFLDLLQAKRQISMIFVPFHVKNTDNTFDDCFRNNRNSVEIITQPFQSKLLPLISLKTSLWFQLRVACHCVGKCAK